jgi:hypothetical protein
MITKSIAHLTKAGISNLNSNLWFMILHVLSIPKQVKEEGELETEMSDKEGKWLPYNLNNGPHDCRKKNDK